MGSNGKDLPKILIGKENEGEIVANCGVSDFLDKNLKISRKHVPLKFIFSNIFSVHLK